MNFLTTFFRGINMSKLTRFLVGSSAFALAFFSAPASAVTVYSQNFEGAVPAEFSGGGSVQGSQGLSAFGFGQQHWKNDGSSATILTLGGLATHTTVTLNFNLAMWDSIDLGNDIFTISINGNTVYSTSTDFGNYFPGDNIGHGPGSNITAPFTAFATPNYGYSPTFRDSARFATFTVNDSASALDIRWQFPNTQGGSDESFGVDNIVVQTNAGQQQSVPEPATLVLLGLGLAGLGLSRRKGS